MICYFAQRDMTILLSASTGLRDGIHIRDDKKTEDIEAGQDTFSGYLRYGDGERTTAETAAEVGNYILKKSDKDEFYTIIESECNPVAQEVYFYAEAAGLDLIGEYCEPYEATESMTLAQYIAIWAEDTGWEIGVDETDGAVKALMWEDAETAMARILSTAASFNMEVSTRYEIDRLSITHKYLDFYEKKGSTIYEPLRKGRDFSELRVKKSIAEVATALRVTGGTPDGAGIKRSSDDSYTWVKFSEYMGGRDEEDVESMSDDTHGMQFIGISAGNATEEESEDPDVYAWEMMKKGSTLIVVPSTTGHQQSKKVNGTTRYTWIMFGTDENGSNMSDQPDDRTYLGYAVNKTSATKSLLQSDYTWVPLDSDAAGRDIFISPASGGISEGNGRYTWIKFSAYEDGTGMSNSRIGANYIGMRFHMESATESSDPADYEWRPISINTTNGGFVMASVCHPGILQSDGTFLWFLFAKDAYGNDKSFNPTDRPYLGIAYDQTSSLPTFDADDYEWSLISADESQAISLKGMSYDDGDFYVDSDGKLLSRTALETWSRYVSPDETGDDAGHIVADFTSDATNQQQLLDEAIEELTRRREAEKTYELDLISLPEGVGIGDTMPLVDPDGDVYLSARLVRLETSEERGTVTGTLSNYKKYDTSLSAQIATLRKKQEELSTRKYTWVVYADSPAGDGLRTDPTDAAYIGIAYDKTVAVPDLTDPLLYTWSLIDTGVVDVASVTWYYLLQDEALDPPDSPTDETPAGWTTTEPDYTEGSTDILYVVSKTTYTDGTYEYGDVSVSSSYEAAKTAYAKAVGAEKTATYYLSADMTGIMVADMTDGTTRAPSDVESGTNNAFIDSDGFHVRNGTTDMSFFGQATQVGPASSVHVTTDPDNGIRFYNADGDIVGEIAYKTIYVNYQPTQVLYVKFGECNDDEEAGNYSFSTGNCIASGEYAVAMGNANIASGDNSVAIGHGLTASTADSVVLGVSNVEDTNGDYLLILGNGNTSTGTESDAMTVTWDGDICCAVNTNAVSGTDADLYQALTDIGWWSEVVE